MGEKLTEAGARRLALAPGEWERVPMFGDSRPMGPLLKSGLIEQRNIDVTPEDWGSAPIRVVRTEWRITPAGREALSHKGRG